MQVRDRALTVLPGTHVPILRGMRVRLRSTVTETPEWIEFGATNATDGKVAVRTPGELAYREAKLEDAARYAWGVEDVDPHDWPIDDLARAIARWDGLTRYSASPLAALRVLRWSYGADEFVTRVWPMLSHQLLALRTEWNRGTEVVPVLHGTRLDLVVPTERTPDQARSLPALPPTQAGWRAFVEAAGSGRHTLTYTALNDVATSWWGQTLPRGLNAATESEAA